MLHCGGCQGLGNHKRWCEAVHGPMAAQRGRWAYQLGNLADEIGGNEPGLANILYREASNMTHMAENLSIAFKEVNQIKKTMGEPI